MKSNRRSAGNAANRSLSTNSIRSATPSRCGIVAGDRQRGRADVDGRDARLRAHAGPPRSPMMPLPVPTSATAIGRSPAPRGLDQIQQRHHQQLGFGPRNQHVGRDAEIERIELATARPDRPPASLRPGGAPARETSSAASSSAGSSKPCRARSAGSRGRAASSTSASSRGLSEPCCFR